MADIFDFYVYDDRSIRFTLAEPIMLEDKDVTQFRFRIPKVLNNIDMTDWEWWFIFVNAKKVKYTTQLTLEDDEDDPDNFSVATYTVGYGFSGYVGSVSFSIEALNVSGEDIVNEWHTRTYNTHVIDTLQGTRAVIPEPEGDASTGLTAEEKSLILELFSKAAYAEDDASTAYDRLEALWTVITRLVSLNLTHVTSSNQSASVENGSRYVTTLTADTNYSINEVTVTMGGVDITSTAYSSGTVTIPSVTGNIVITASAVLAAQSITAVYTQSGTVYDTDSLDSLKADLVVTANYAGGTSETVPSSDYTLSGTLTAGTSAVTVTYAGLTTTFNVTVTANPMVLKYNFDFTQSLVDSVASNTATLGGSASRSSSGVSLTTASDTITFASPLCTSTGNVRIEVDIGNASKAFASGHGRLVTWNSNGTMGLIYRNTGRWEVYQSSWITPTDAVTDATYIADNTVIIEIGPSTASGSLSTATANVYIGDKTIASNITVKTYAGATDGATSMTIGSTGGNTFYNVTIKAIRVYENNGE